MIPKLLYEILPYGYLLIGLFGLTGVDNIIGKCCGVILIAMGVVIQQTRARYRSGERVSRRIVATIACSGRPVATAGLDPISKHRGKIA